MLLRMDFVYACIRLGSVYRYVFQEKCMQYWAEEKDLTFGTVTVKPGRVETTTDYDIRHLSIIKVRFFFK